MLSSSVHDKIQRLGAEEEPQWHWQMKAQAVDLRQMKMLQTNHDGLQECQQAFLATFNAWRREKQITTDHEECIKMTSRTKHHDSNEYEKAPRLRYTVNSQASIGFVDNL